MLLLKLQSLLVLKLQSMKFLSPLCAQSSILNFYSEKVSPVRNVVTCTTNHITKPGKSDLHLFWSQSVFHLTPEKLELFPFQDWEKLCGLSKKKFVFLYVCRFFVSSQCIQQTTVNSEIIHWNTFLKSISFQHYQSYYTTWT